MLIDEILKPKKKERKMSCGQTVRQEDNDGGHPLGALAAATVGVAGAADRARISERAYNHPMRTARGHHRAASGVVGRPWAREKRFRDVLGVGV